MVVTSAQIAFLLALSQTSLFVFGPPMGKVGNVKEERDFDGLLRTFTRDNAGRVRSIDRPDCTAVTAVKYSDGTAETYAYRSDGALVEASNPSAQVKFDRDD